MMPNDTTSAERGESDKSDIFHYADRNDLRTPMGIRTLIQRGSVYTLLFAIVIAFFLATVFLIGYLSQDADEQSDLFGAGITTIVGIFAIPFLEKYFRKATDKIFFKDKYDYSHAMYSLSEVLNNNIDLEELPSQLQKVLEKIFRVPNVCIVASSAKTQPDAPEGGVVIPIRLRNETLGCIELGRKLSGDPYTSEDITLLRTFSYQAAVAMEKAKLYAQVTGRSEILEEKVRKRTAELEKMREAERRTLLDISHDLQTPLTIAKGELEALKNQGPSRRKIELLEYSIDKASKSIENILKLAQLESNVRCAENEQIDLGALLGSVLEYVSVIIEGKGIVLRKSIASDIFFPGRKNEIEELFTNLISNAIKYTESSRLKIVTVILEKSASTIGLSIEDTGIGIGENDLPHIFERFYKAKLRDSSIKSTGLGLAISKCIAENHGGMIIAESKLNSGTKITVTFPLPAKCHIAPPGTIPHPPADEGPNSLPCFAAKAE